MNLKPLADHRVHGLPEHIERDAQRDIEKVFLCERMRFLVDGAAEQGEDGFAENEINRCQHKAADHAKHHGIADGLVGVLPGIASQRDAYERAAAVTDKHGDAKGNYGHWENDSVCRVAVGAEVACVRNKDLVNDVIERTYQQRDNTGDSVLTHELSNALRPQKLISGFQKNHLSFKK